MATYTTYLNLEKPTTSETFNLLKMNQNWDKIDAGVSALNSKLTGYNIYNLGAITMPFTLSVPSNSRHILFLNGPYTNRGRAVIIFNANISGNISAIKIGGDDQVALDTSVNNALSISDSAGATTIPYVTVLTTLGSNVSIA